MLDGRVKTLHPKIHAGILHDRLNKKHRGEMNKKKFPSIDLIIVNFYPFQKIVTKSSNSKKIIENIDIGGPTMVRSAAKNFNNVTIITNKNDYQSLIEEINNRLHESTLLSSLVAAISCARIARRRSQFYPPAAGIQR